MGVIPGKKKAIGRLVPRAQEEKTKDWILGKTCVYGADDPYNCPKVYGPIEIQNKKNKVKLYENDREVSMDLSLETSWRHLKDKACQNMQITLYISRLWYKPSFC